MNTLDHRLSPEQSKVLSTHQPTLVTNALRSGEAIEHVSTAVGHRSTRVTSRLSPAEGQTT